MLSTYGFNSTLTLTLLQGLVTVLCLDVMKARGWVNFPTFNFKTAWQVASLSFVFVAYVVVSLVSLGKVRYERACDPVVQLTRLTTHNSLVRVCLRVWPRR